ncbi:S41 family peptidase [Mucisphaera calidilacus]|uniref:Putative CtpA-like serine protease n=1 Tax=Mucisphaera calidilacus TaxID=2527982 RepID=A0A518BXC9_9BACT|nr:S41 family peptidase [Mucisphaera calidilacus]QDU71604.1 putative CtpA-like serine protease [Mucisphaera calidilacus]
MNVIKSVEVVSPRRRLVGNVALVAVFVALILFALSSALGRSVGDDLALIVDVRHFILNQHIEEVDSETLTEAAINGMIGALDDPYTDYFPPEALKAFSEQIDGEFSGIGAEVDLKDERLRIISPLEGSPAWESGVLAGDIVLEIDGESTEGMPLRECIKRLKGVRGTDVTISVLHLSGEEQEITITRDTIQVTTVRGLTRDAELHESFWIDKERGIAYVRLTQFGAKSIEEFTAAMNQLKAEDVKALILDLRFNLGGLLPAAQAISDMFLTEGQTIVSVRARTGEEQFSTSTAETIFPDLPVAVLINDVSASASEIVSGALKDNGRARLIGVRTFGKGSVQNVHEFAEAGSALKLTTAYYYIPSGRKIHRVEGAETWGIDPSDGGWVSMSFEETKAMMEVRRDAAIRRAESHETVTRTTFTADEVRETLKDPQLAAALESAGTYLDSGAWPTVGAESGDAILKLVKRERLERSRDRLREALAAVEEELVTLDEPETEAAAADESAVEEDVIESAGP